MLVSTAIGASEVSLVYLHNSEKGSLPAYLEANGRTCEIEKRRLSQASL